MSSVESSYMPTIAAFTQRSSFWPPEAFTLDCRIEERIWEWCEDSLKNNAEFMALVNSDKPLPMDALWSTIHNTAYDGLTNCIFHYWLILNYNSYKAGGRICQENADWICRKLTIRGPMPWAAAAKPQAAVAENCSICVTSGNTMSIFKLSTVPNLTTEDLREWRTSINLFIAESYSPEDCAAAERILAAVNARLNG